MFKTLNLLLISDVLYFELICLQFITVISNTGVIINNQVDKMLSRLIRHRHVIHYNVRHRHVIHYAREYSALKVVKIGLRRKRVILNEGTPNSNVHFQTSQ